MKNIFFFATIFFIFAACKDSAGQARIISRENGKTFKKYKVVTIIGNDTLEVEGIASRFHQTKVGDTIDIYYWHTNNGYLYFDTK